MIGPVKWCFYFAFLCKLCSLKVYYEHCYEGVKSRGYSLGNNPGMTETVVRILQMVFSMKKLNFSSIGQL